MMRSHLIAFVILLAVSTALGQTIDTKRPLKAIYDASKNETIVFVSSVMTVAEETQLEVWVVNDGKRRLLPSTIAKMVVYFKHPGKQAAVPDAVTIAFDMGTWNKFRFTDFRELVFTADSERFELGPMNLTGRKDMGRGGPSAVVGMVQYWETLELPLKVDVYRRIINSKTVSMQIGDQTASLDEGQLKQLRDLAGKYLK